MALQDGSVRISSEPECNAVMDMSLLTQNICTCVAIMKRLVCLKCGVLSNSVTEPSPMTWSFLSKVLETERKSVPVPCSLCLCSVGRCSAGSNKSN